MKGKRVNPKSFHHKEDFFLYFFTFVSLRDNGCSLNLLWSSFHDVCESNFCAVCLKLTVLCVYYISIKLEEKNLQGNSEIVINERAFDAD